MGSVSANSGRRAKRAVVVSNPLFKLLVILVGALCLVCLIVLAALASLAPEPMTKAQDHLMMASGWGFTTTLGALIGLLGGRAASPDSLPKRLEPLCNPTHALAIQPAALQSNWRQNDGFHAKPGHLCACKECKETHTSARELSRIRTYDRPFLCTAHAKKHLFVQRNERGHCQVDTQMVRI